jgi:cyclophilin family peptidyl-prolyl cis-trans isomerase
MMRKTAVSRGNGSNAGSNTSSKSTHYAEMNSSATSLSYNHMALPSSPRKVRQTLVLPSIPFDRKDSDASINVDFSENSNESITLQSCFDKCSPNDTANNTANNNIYSNASSSHLNMSTSNLSRKKRQYRPAPSSLSFPQAFQQLQHLRPAWIIMMFAICAICCCAGAIFFFEKYEDQHDAAIRMKMRMDEIGPLSNELQGKLAAVETENARLKTKLQQEEDEIGSLRKRTDKDLPTLQEKITQLEGYKKDMRRSIQHMSIQKLHEKYGNGPHRVEVQLAFDPDSKLEGTADRIVLEMAPADEMPHTVYWFLEQVDHKHYDKCSFHRNANHVIQAGPVGNFLTAPNEGLLKRFKESGFESVLFQEYSDIYKHYKYTLGLAGRPGGPDFYINMQDNSRLHGPGGQIESDDADPCFARVVEGFDAVARMHQSDIDEDGGYRHMRHNVAIRHMRLLPPDYKVA